MRVEFIHHSCFLVEIDNVVLIFDYFNGNHVNGYSFTGKLPSYEKDTKIYMFASHSHADHYDMDILRMEKEYPNLKYIFSKDIRISPNFLEKHGIDSAVRNKVLFVKPDHNYELDELKITTFHSTDSGVAFYVTINGVSVYHSGDLNDWKMEGAGDLINGKMRRTYRHEINKLKNLPINVAFVPLDPRLMEHMFEGIRYFLETTDAEYVFPMHMWQDYSGISVLKKQLTNRSMADRIMDISRENQTFLFEEG